MSRWGWGRGRGSRGAGGRVGTGECGCGMLCALRHSGVPIEDLTAWRRELHRGRFRARSRAAGHRHVEEHRILVWALRMRDRVPACGGGLRLSLTRCGAHHARTTRHRGGTGSRQNWTGLSGVGSISRSLSPTSRRSCPRCEKPTIRSSRHRKRSGIGSVTPEMWKSASSSSPIPTGTSSASKPPYVQAWRHERWGRSALFPPSAGVRRSRVRQFIAVPVVPAYSSASFGTMGAIRSIQAAGVAEVGMTMAASMPRFA